MKKALTENLILKILSVFLAILIWLLVLNINDPATTRQISGIHVDVLNDSVITDNDMVYKVTEGQTVSVKVTGPRTIVDSLTASDFVAKADFQDISQANSIPISVELDDYNLMQKVTIQTQSPNTMKLKVEDVVEEAYDVQIRYMGSMPEGYLIEKTILEVSTVKIRAAVSVHEKIKEVCVNVDVREATQDFQAELDVKAYTGTGVEVLQATKEATVDVEKILVNNLVYYTKTLPITYAELAQISEDVIVSDVKLSKNNVKVKGKKAVLDGIENIVLSTEHIAIDGSEKEFVFPYPLVDLLPEGVYLNEDVKNVELKVYINRYLKEVLTVKTEDIAIKNIPDGLDASIESSGQIEIVIEGLEQDIEKLEMENVLAYVSLKNHKEGISTVPIEIQLPEGLEMVGTVTVDVKLASTIVPPSVEEPSSQEDETTTEKKEPESDLTTPPSQDNPSETPGTGESDNPDADIPGDDKEVVEPEV